MDLDTEGPVVLIGTSRRVFLKSWFILFTTTETPAAAASVCCMEHAELWLVASCSAPCHLNQATSTHQSPDNSRSLYLSLRISCRGPSWWMVVRVSLLMRTSCPVQGMGMDDWVESQAVLAQTDLLQGLGLWRREGLGSHLPFQYASQGSHCPEQILSENFITRNKFSFE